MFLWGCTVTPDPNTSDNNTPVLQVDRLSHCTGGWDGTIRNTITCKVR